MKPKIALATSSEYPALIQGEALLIKAFVAASYDARPVIWDDPLVDWGSFDFVILRMCWDYHTKIAKFCAWLDTLAKHDVTLLNPQDVVRWNMHKSYLLELQQIDVPIPQTTLIRQDDERNLSDVLAQLAGDVFIVKPCYGASAFGIIKLDRTSAGLPETIASYKKLLTHSDVLVQAFVPEIVNGEISAMFFDGIFSHAVIKSPKQGEFRSQIDFGGLENRIKLDGESLVQVKELFAACNTRALYARLDYIPTKNGLMLMELELIEPYLFFDFDDHATERFIKAFETCKRVGELKMEGSAYNR